MCRSKLLIVSSLIIMLVSACTKPDSKPDGINGNDGAEGLASFRIGKVDGDGTILQVPTTTTDPSTNLTYASIWRIPREVSYRFTACIIDRSTNKSALGHQFAVEIPETRARIADVPPTTGEGCFSWHESIPFAYFVKRSKWIVLERDIVGLGVHTGKQRIKVAINPWSVGQGARDGGDEFRFLREKPLPTSLLVPAPQADAALSGNSLGEDKLYIGDVDIQTIRLGESNRGTMFRMNIEMNPKIRFENQEGVPAYKPVVTGDFYVIAHLVMNHTGDKLNERTILTRAAERSDLQSNNKDLGVVGTGRVVDGKLIAQVSAWVEGRLPQGNLELVLKVIPKGLRGLAPAEGIYELGAFRNLSSHFSGSLNKNCREDGPCDIASYLKESENFEKLRESHYASDNSPYLFDRLNLRFAQVEPGETTTQRQVTYTASTCITDAFTGERPVGLPLIITYKEKDSSGKVKDGRSITDQKTGEDGCLRWSATIPHKYYQPERFLEQNIVVSKASGFERPMKFFINPWDDKFTFGFDEREFGETFWKSLAGRKKIPSRFFMADFGYHTVRFQYNIDALMALEVRKTVLMELEPRVLRYSGIINARKMTEPLRDGIWLMKVGIQKNYLDPAQVGVHIDALKEYQAASASGDIEPAKANKSLTIGNSAKTVEDGKDARTRLRRLGIDAPAREFISTQTALVRSTDGAIIQPVEFTMQDLRMMRVRSNFLIELQPVDEQALQAENVVHENFDLYLDYLKKIGEQRTQKSRNLGKSSPDYNDVQKATAEEDARVNNMIMERRKKTRELFSLIEAQLNQNNRSGVSMTPFQLTQEQQDYFKISFDGTVVPQSDVQANLNTALGTNDFTTIKLPNCAELDCNRFVERGEAVKDAEGNVLVSEFDDLSEKGPGLIRRTFVGPVIFLSNGYKDSVRATDNLDEARCGAEVDYKDPREREMDDFRRSLFNESENHVRIDRQNTFYKFSEYFGSLRHLCKSHVDDLIAREDRYRHIYKENIPAVGSVYNFSQAYSMNFLSLTNEQPKSVSFDPSTFERCENNLTKCMTPTTQNWIPLPKAMQVINSRLGMSGGVVSTVKSWITGSRDVKNTAWDVQDLKRSFFGNDNENSRRYAACALVSASFAQSLKANNAPIAKIGVNRSRTFDVLEEEVMEKCLANSDSPVHYDLKLRVFKTGQSDDSYVFLGGYQMNINVGQSFSVGRSSGYSLGAGIEGTDFVGGAGGIAGSVGRLASSNPAGTIAAAGGGALGKVAERIAPFTSLIKPLSIKAGWGTSMSESDGTSISESTYLVAQIAKFRVRLDEYERCYAIGFTKEFLNALGVFGILNYDPERYGSARSLFVCEGTKIVEPRYVDEMYFYFTQHFTEGDMLDQADLYNHPWLLALRGYRDFGSFISLIRKQESVSFWTMTKNWIWPQQRKVDWPLEHMRTVYKRITPSFPGFYTVLQDNEGITDFPLEMSKTDMDMNFEVRAREKRLDLQRNANRVD